VVVHKLQLPISEKLFWTMGNQNLTIGRAIAEFVDNSFDARIGTTEVDVDIQDEAIIIKDTSSGMDISSLKEALIPSESRERTDSVGGYGFGLKTASAFLGDSLELVTATVSMENALLLKIQNPFDGQSDMSNSTYTGFWEIDVLEIPKDFTQGTIIKISNLRRPRQINDVESVINHFSKTFAKFLQKGHFSLRVNKTPIIPYNFDVYDSRSFKFTVPNKNGEVCEVEGWVGVSKALHKSTTADSENGYHLYLNGRLLDYNSWIGLERHPELRLLAGEIYLTGFKSNITKTEIIKESYEYILFYEEFERWLKDNSIRKFINEKTKEFTNAEKKNKSSRKKSEKNEVNSTKDNKKPSEENGDKQPENSPPSNDLSDFGTTNAKTSNVDSSNKSEVTQNPPDKDNKTQNNGLKVIRNGWVDAFQLEIYIKKVKWRVLFKEGGKSNQICDINHHEKEMTLDSDRDIFKRYVEYVQKHPQNYST